MNRFKSFISTMALVASMVPAPALAEEALFTLSGTNSKGQAVEIPFTETLAQEIGVIELSTKVVSEGEAIRKVRGAEIDATLKKADLVGKILHVVALDGYAVDLPREDFTNYGAVFAMSIDGKKLTVRDKGPSWIIYPVSKNKELDDPVFEARSVWQLKTVTVSDQ